MKISNEEVNAANYELTRYVEGRGNITAVTDALEAAYRVRKERKKREKHKPIGMDEMLHVHEGWDKQNDIDMYGGKVTQWPQKVKSEPDNHYTNMHLEQQGSGVSPKPLTFEAGKSYRTRDGQRVCLEKSGIRFLEGALHGVSACWHGNGKYYRDGIHHLDLVALWED